MKIALISDTHNLHKKIKNIPKADLIIHAGDCTENGSKAEFTHFINWYSNLPHARKILVAGNHDWCFYSSSNSDLDYREAEAICEDLGIIYLLDNSVEINGVKFYGTPWQPAFCDWAFNIEEESKRKIIFNMIPEDTNVLISHCPPYGIMDKTKSGVVCGCQALLNKVQIIKPKYHIFGHIHEGYGM